MKTFILLLKSYSDAPDYEDELQANSKAQAVMYWYKQLQKYGWDKELLEISITEL